jgi:hypothetical protein
MLALKMPRNLQVSRHFYQGCWYYVLRRELAMSYVIRPAQATDAPQLAALREQCHRRRMAIRRNTLTLVCEEEGTLLGFVTAECLPMLSLPGLGRTAWSVIELCVPGQETGGNVGAALLQEINHKAKAQAGHVDILL